MLEQKNEKKDKSSSVSYRFQRELIGNMHPEGSGSFCEVLTDCDPAPWSVF